MKLYDWLVLIAIIVLLANVFIYVWEHEIGAASGWGLALLYYCLYEFKPKEDKPND